LAAADRWHGIPESSAAAADRFNGRVKIDFRRKNPPAPIMPPFAIYLLEWRDAYGGVR
jgi:hypothetical protein